MWWTTPSTGDSASEAVTGQPSCAQLLRELKADPDLDRGGVEELVETSVDEFLGLGEEEEE